MRISRWKPECPECGYSLRTLHSPRCPECGHDFPTTNKHFRRWAARRLPWDRADRGSIASAYLKTVATVFFVPWRAGRAIAIPDRWPRTVRWAFAHLAIAILALTLLANGRYYSRWLIARYWPPDFNPPHMTNYLDGPADRVAVWFIQSVAAWAVVVLGPVAIGAGLSLLIPGRRRAAKLCGLKWSLLLTLIFLTILVVWNVYFAIRSPDGIL